MLLLLVYMLVPVTNMFSLLPPGLNRRTYDKHQVSITTSLINECAQDRRRMREMWYEGTHTCNRSFEEESHGLRCSQTYNTHNNIQLKWIVHNLPNAHILLMWKNFWIIFISIISFFFFTLIFLNNSLHHIKVVQKKKKF